MPNYCENKLVVIGQSENLKKFVDKYFVDGKLDFNKVVPEPESKNECPLAYQNPVRLETGNRPWFDWWNWRIDHWGTKWNVCGQYPDIKECYTSDNSISYKFDTAWSPPIPVIQKMIEDFPELHITLYYYECGMCFAGIYDSVDGDIEYAQDELHQFAINYMDYSKEDFNYD